ncbi:nuclear transport factor 2 family protein [Enemella evansiae]|uniref:Ester cyclase n=1 Tax=Enemella evansiae TaxID=2016499 RepID=A0A255GLN7_9ACTN|nr:ester cyclase [Enemella evansiae]OYO01987.1 hypothetical protein CGZ97_16425 [Enemella evansiae]OYO10847.1 hypothetical protein CGZ98_09340 [Enemella evansiae]OYO16745.1 hypothetical protein CGZ94_03690 [Enemella evansiae]PFG65746.1 SnoaL-like polyketide cyclase [Propionibacteriaceae bacterium ES.041]
MALDEVAYRPYADPDAFIREVTDLIWVDKDISHIYDNYEPDSIVHGPFGTAIGVEQVVQGSTMRMATDFDHVGQAEDVIWEARGDDAFLSSHLVFASDPVDTPNGRRITSSRTIANCLYRRGRMVEEWVVRDELAKCLNRGLDPDEVARRQKFVGYQPSLTDDPPADVLAAGDSGPRPDEYRGECELVLEMIDSVWSRRNLNTIKDFFDRDLFLHTVGDATLIRPRGYGQATLDLVSAFPDATFEVRDVQTNNGVRYGGLRIAVLWKMRGSYTGIAKFGPLTGAPIDLLGISQFQLHEGRIVREMRVYDEIGLRAQINATRGDLVHEFDNLY